MLEMGGMRCKTMMTDEICGYAYFIESFKHGWSEESTREHPGKSGVWGGTEYESHESYLSYENKQAAEHKICLSICLYQDYVARQQRRHNATAAAIVDDNVFVDVPTLPV
jgi:hypothetical protein